MSDKIFYKALLGSMAVLLLSCKKYLEVGPPTTQLASSTIFKNDATAVSAQLAIYAQMEAERLPYNLILNTGLSADELTDYSGNSSAVDLFTNNLTSSNTYVLTTWTQLYKYIYEANAVIEGLNNSYGLTEAVKKQLLGEAKFTRAFCHFYLVNLFGKVPILTSTDYTENGAMSRSEVQDVYNQIILDLTEAKELIPSAYIAANGTATSERVRPTKWAAIALLARVYLYTGNWNGAFSAATDVIANASLFALIPDLNAVFLKNSNEAIWQLSSVLPRYNTYVGGTLILTSAPVVAAIAPTLVASFENGDKRYSSWIKSITIGNGTYYYPYKYKVPQNASSITEYTMLLRLAELYLIRAEAEAMQNNLTDALSDINKLRTRAGLLSATATTQSQLLEQIKKERNTELFTEIGDRWLNLKRTGSSTLTLQSIKGMNWTAGVDELYPIPQSEISRNARLTQNSGY